MENSIVNFLSIIIILLQINSIICSYNLIKSGGLNLPAHTYRLTCNNGCTINVAATWTHGSDLQLYLFRQNQNLLDYSIAIKSSTSGSLSAESFSYQPSNNFGYYYVRVVPYNLNTSYGNVLPYTIVLSGTGSSVSYTANMNVYFPSRATVPFSLTSACNFQIKYSLSSSTQTQLSLRSPLGNYIYLNVSNLTNYYTIKST